VSLKIKKYPDLSGPLYHYAGTVCLRFSKAVWTYFLDDGVTLTPIRGVTNTLKVIGGKKTDMLIGWAVKKDMEKLLALLAECRRADNFVEAPWDDIAELVAVSKREHKQILETAGEIGHGAHEHLELIANALIASDDSRLGELLAKWPADERSCNAAVAAIAFLSDHNVRFISSEQRVLSREWLVCGTADGDALLDSCTRAECSCQKYAPFTDKRVVLDYKTSNGVWTSYFGQMAFYRKALEEESVACGTPIHYDGSVLLRIGKDDASEFETFFTFGDEEYGQHLALFKRALDLKESLDQVEGWMDAIKDEVKENEKRKKAADKEAAHRIRCPKADDYKGSRRTTCFDDGTQCEACLKIWLDKHRAAV
jgi:hypothetical protein